MKRVMRDVLPTVVETTEPPKFTTLLSKEDKLVLSQHSSRLLTLRHPWIVPLAYWTATSRDVFRKAGSAPLKHELSQKRWARLFQISSKR